MNNIKTENNYGDVFGLETIVNALKQTAEITKSNAESTAAIVADLQNTKDVLGGVAKRVKDIGDNLTNINDRMANLEQNEEITTYQNENITESVKRRLFEILGTDELDIHKYYRIFAQRLYANARKNSGMGSKVARTKKRDYQRVIDYVEAWTPVGGCAKLMAEADVKAEARRIAKQQGYDC